MQYFKRWSRIYLVEYGKLQISNREWIIINCYIFEKNLKIYEICTRGVGSNRGLVGDNIYQKNKKKCAMVIVIVEVNVLRRWKFSFLQLINQSMPISNHQIGDCHLRIQSFTQLVNHSFKHNKQLNSRQDNHEPIPMMLMFRNFLL